MDLIIAKYMTIVLLMMVSVTAGRAITISDWRSTPKVSILLAFVLMVGAGCCALALPVFVAIMAPATERAETALALMLTACNIGMVIGIYAADCAQPALFRHLRPDARRTRRSDYDDESPVESLR